jgi:hypothetical protein
MAGFIPKAITKNKIKKGMLISFAYRGEDMHDERPLVYILEIKGDRVWGYNLHYDRKLFNALIKSKQDEISRLMKSHVKTQEKPKSAKEKTLEWKKQNQNLNWKKDKESVDKETQKIQKEKQEKVAAQNKIPAIIFETYEMKATNHEEMLRSYLGKGIRNIAKMVFTI